MLVDTQTLVDSWGKYPTTVHIDNLNKTDYFLEHSLGLHIYIVIYIKQSFIKMGGVGIGVVFTISIDINTKI